MFVNLPCCLIPKLVHFSQLYLPKKKIKICISPKPKNEFYIYIMKMKKYLRNLSWTSFYWKNKVNVYLETKKISIHMNLLKKKSKTWRVLLETGILGIWHILSQRKMNIGDLHIHPKIIFNYSKNTKKM